MVSCATRRRWRLAACSLALLWCAVGCVDVPAAAEFADQRCSERVPAEGADALELVVILPMTDAAGGERAASVARSRAVELAVREANERKGVRGRSFRLRVCDSGGAEGEESTRAEAIASWLVGSAQAPAAILTGGTGETLAVHEATRSAGTLVLSISATTLDITDWDDGGLLWRVAPSDELQGLTMTYLLQKQQAKQVAVLASADAYGDSLAKVVRDNAPDGVTVKTFAVQADAAAVAQSVSDAAATKPDHLVLITDTSLGAKVLDAVAANAGLASAKLVLGDFLKRTALFAQVADAGRLTGALGTTPGDPPGKTFAAFADRFQQLFKADATQQSYTAHAYDAAWCVMLAHAWALRDGATAGLVGSALAEGLGKVADTNAAAVELEPTNFATARKALLAGQGVNIHGASGPLDFNLDTGEPTSAVEVWQVDTKQTFVPQYWVQIVLGRDGKPQFAEIQPPAP